MATDTIWMYGVEEPTSYHDSSCPCKRHCLNCRADLDGHDGTDPRGPRTRYCSTYCQGVMDRERAFDRFMQAQSLRKDGE